MYIINRKHAKPETNTDPTNIELDLDIEAETSSSAVAYATTVPLAQSIITMHIYLPT